MSATIKQAINSLKTRISAAYTKIAEKGGTLPATQDSANLPAAIESIPSGGGDWDVYMKFPHQPSLSNMFTNALVKLLITSFKLDSATGVTNASYVFNGCTNLEKVEIPTDWNNCKDMNGTFNNCTNLASDIIINAPVCTTMDLMIKHDASDCVTINKVEINAPLCTNFYLFSNNRKIKEVVIGNNSATTLRSCCSAYAAQKKVLTKATIGTSSAASCNYNSMFYYQTNMVECHLGDISNASSVEYMFSFCNELEVFSVEALPAMSLANLFNEGRTVGYDYNGCQKLNKASLASILNALPQLGEGISYTIGLGATNIGKINADPELAALADIAVNTKHWILA